MNFLKNTVFPSAGLGFLFYGAMILVQTIVHPGGTSFGGSCDSRVAIIGTVFVAIVARVKQWRKTWNWTDIEAIVFLTVGAVLIWGFSYSSSGRSGFNFQEQTFSRDLSGLGEASALIFALALLATIPAWFYHTLTTKE